jgi:endonuclease/exonuclease/phosphatase family metal-dependent hydrolase
MSRRRTLSVAVHTLLSAGIFSAPMSASSADSKVKVMFYNVYNLFDAEHDAQKDDWTFLPKNYPGKNEYCNTLTNDNYKSECLTSDWTEESVKIKLNQLQASIKANVGNEMPDLLGLSEVENENVVGMLAEKLGYSSFVMTQSPDKRGIDVALLYKESSSLKFVESEEHVYPELNGRPLYTRNLLEASFKIDGEKLQVFVNHWPSQAAPATVREHVAKEVKRIVDLRQTGSRPAHILMMGDFNVVANDYPHSLNSIISDKSKAKHLLDAHELFQSSSAPKSVKNLLAHGTYFYPPTFSWDRLDRFFVSKNLNDNSGVEIVPESYRILSDELIRSKYEYKSAQFSNFGSVIEGVPYRANINATSQSNAGFGDHFPIYVELKF